MQRIIVEGVRGTTMKQIYHRWSMVIKQWVSHLELEHNALQVEVSSPTWLLMAGFPISSMAVPTTSCPILQGTITWCQLCVHADDMGFNKYLRTPRNGREKFCTPHNTSHTRQCTVGTKDELHTMRGCCGFRFAIPETILRSATLTVGKTIFRTWVWPLHFL